MRLAVAAERSTGGIIGRIRPPAPPCARTASTHGAVRRTGRVLLTAALLAALSPFPPAPFAPAVNAGDAKAGNRAESSSEPGLPMELEARVADSDDGAGAYLDLDVVVPLYHGRREDRGLFLQPGLVLSMDSGSRTRYGLGAGLAYRFLSGKGVYGVNAFYDRNWIEDELWEEDIAHERVSVGVDYQDRKSHISANYYHPISGDYQRYDLSAHHREYATSAIDLFYKASIGEDWSSKSRIYYEIDRDFETPTAFRRDGENRLVVSSGVAYRLGCNASAGLHVAHDFLTGDITPSIALTIAFGGSGAAAACRAGRPDDVRRRLFGVVQREKLVRPRVVVSPYVLTMLPDDIEALWAVIGGDANSDVVWLYEQGGPAGELRDPEELRTSPLGDLADEYEQATGTEPYLVNVHQIQTYNPGLFERTDFAAVEQVQAEMNLSVEILDRAIRHFKAQGKEVVVIGSSFGAFVLPHYLALKGPGAADRYVIAAGRLDMNEAVYKDRLSKLHSDEPVVYGFDEDGLTPVRTGSSDVGDDGRLSIEQRMSLVFQGVFGRHRYTGLLKDTDLTKVIYAYGLYDEAVGRLTDREVGFLVSKKADIVAADGGHGSMLENDDSRAEILHHLLN